MKLQVVNLKNSRLLVAFFLSFFFLLCFPVSLSHADGQREVRILKQGHPLLGGVIIFVSRRLDEFIYLPLFL